MSKDNGESGAVSQMAGSVRGIEGDLRPSQAPGQVAGLADPLGGGGNHQLPQIAAAQAEVQPSTAVETDIGFSVTLPRKKVEETIDRAIKQAAYAEAVARGIAPPCNETEFRFKAKVTRYKDGRAAVTMEV